MEPISFRQIVEEYLKDRFPPTEDFSVEMVEGTRFMVVNSRDGYFHPIAVVHEDSIYALTPKKFPIKEGPIAVRLYAYEPKMFVKLNKIIKGWLKLRKERKNG